MSKYLIENKDNEVIFREITFNLEEYGDGLVELTKDELDQQLKEYSNQDLYVSVFHQVETVNHGIQFVRNRFTVDIFTDKPEYKWKPIEKDINLEREYFIKENLTDMEVIRGDENFLTEFPSLEKYLTELEFLDKVRDYLSKGLDVHFTQYEYKWKKWKLTKNEFVKGVTEDGKILYR